MEEIREKKKKLIVLKKERERKEKKLSSYQELDGSTTETVVINLGRTSWQIDDTLLELLFFSFSERNRLTVGDGIDSISISASSSSSLKCRVEESVLVDNIGDEVISMECCRTIGISGTKALGEWFELTSNDGVENDRSGCIFENPVDVGPCTIGW